MHLSPSRPIEGKIYYIAKSFHNNKGISTKKNVRRLGTLAEIREREGVDDAWVWTKSECERETLLENENRRSVAVRFFPEKRIQKNEQRSFNLEYLIVNKLYYELGIDKICAGIERRGKFAFARDTGSCKACGSAPDIPRASCHREEYELPARALVPLLQGLAQQEHFGNLLRLH